MKLAFLSQCKQTAKLILAFKFSGLLIIWTYADLNIHLRFLANTFRTGKIECPSSHFELWQMPCLLGANPHAAHTAYAPIFICFPRILGVYRADGAPFDAKPAGSAGRRGYRNHREFHILPVGLIPRYRKLGKIFIWIDRQNFLFQFWIEFLYKYPVFCIRTSCRNRSYHGMLRNDSRSTNR